jgi:putative salt-induced outer membrane protein
MTQRKALALVIGILSITTGLVHAEDTPAKNWKVESDLSYVQTTGNTEVLTLAFKNLLEYTFSEKLKGAWNLQALNVETDGEQTAERYYTDLRLDYLFSDRFYGYVLGSWLTDEFAGFDARYALGPGAGYKILVGPKNFLLVEAGLSYAHEDYVAADTADFAEGRAFGQYEYAFTEKNRLSLSSEFLQDLDDTDNYKLNSEAAITSALNDILSLKVAYEVRHQNRPIPAELEETDTVFGAAVVVIF